MNRDDIIRMARETKLGAALTHGGEERVWIEGADWHDELERFAALVAAAEREACAQVCDSIDTYGDRAECWTEYAAELIRARGKK